MSVRREVLVEEQPLVWMPAQATVTCTCCGDTWLADAERLPTGKVRIKRQHCAACWCEEYRIRVHP